MGSWAVFLLLHTNRARAPNADTEQSDPPFQREVDSMGKTAHLISD